MLVSGSKRRATKPVSYSIETPQHARSSNEALHQPMLAGKIKQRHADDDRQQSLTRNSRQREQHTQTDNHQAEQISADEGQPADHRLSATPGKRRYMEIVLRQRN